MGCIMVLVVGMGQIGGGCTMKREGRYNHIKPQSWLQDVRDYVAGRIPEMDPLLDWVEVQDKEIGTDETGTAPMVDRAPSTNEVSKQIWAMLQLLVKVDNTASGIFAKVPRHNGMEAWRRLAEPINENKAMVRKELLAVVTNPRGAATIGNIESAIEDWDTNLR